jgi:hypothetical protein
MRRTAPFMAAAALALFAATACDQPLAVHDPGADLRLAASLGPTLVECPSNTTASVEGGIGVTGGSLVLYGHRLDVPALALKRAEVFSLSDLAGNYVALDLRGGGKEEFGFDRPASITIDYSRCSRSNIEKGPLGVYKIDLATGTLLKFMGGVDDKTARTITFSTESLSTYAIAN